MFHCVSPGVTPAVIENITFTLDAGWLAVSTGHGTTHAYRLQPQLNMQPMAESGSQARDATCPMRSYIPCDSSPRR